MLDTPRPESGPALKDLARKAGIALEWTDNGGRNHSVGGATLHAMLMSMGHPCADERQCSESLQRLHVEYASPEHFPVITASAGSPVCIPFAVQRDASAVVEFETGGAVQRAIVHNAEGVAHLPPTMRPGYHRLQIGKRVLTLAIAPQRCFGVEDLAPGQRLWGLTAQIHGLRRSADGGIGDFGAVAELARNAARYKADALSLSPAHALFHADDHHFTPYSPSSRLFLNAMLADPRATFDAARVARAWASAEYGGELLALEALDLIDWPQAARARKIMLRALYDEFSVNEVLTPLDPLAADFQAFRSAGGEALELHATFEALHAVEFQRDFTKWSWRDWPAQLQDSRSSAVGAFAAANAREVSFHVFTQWLASRSMRAAQGIALDAGMRIGLVSDLAIGMNTGGSQAWSAPRDLLLGLSIGAPPDALAPHGQNWGLTTFAPHALTDRGYAPFIATLRAALRHAGGLRIDHVMGIARLWLTPEGMDASNGAYLAYPAGDLLRLIALESHRHRAIVIGEDLGTVPHGMRERLGDAGVMGMRVMQFERHDAAFNPPDWYPPAAVAMTSTHDTATTAGYWSGHDLAIRAGSNQLPPGQSLEAAIDERNRARAALWDAFCVAGVAQRDREPAPETPAGAVNASVAFLARTPTKLALLPLEDALGVIEQPNLPGTVNEHANWRRRYASLAGECLDAPEVSQRLQPLLHRE